MNPQQPSAEPDYTFYYLNPVTYKPIYETSCYITSQLSRIEGTLVVVKRAGGLYSSAGKNLFFGGGGGEGNGARMAIKR